MVSEARFGSTSVFEILLSSSSRTTGRHKECFPIVTLAFITAESCECGKKNSGYVVSTREVHGLARSYCLKAARWRAKGVGGWEMRHQEMDICLGSSK
jgi:hypothetical protein